MANLITLTIAVTVLLSFLVTVQSQIPICPRGVPSRNQYTRDSVLCPETCGQRVSYAGFSIGTRRRTIYKCCSGEEPEEVGRVGRRRIFSCPPTEGSADEQVTEPDNLPPDVFATESPTEPDIGSSTEPPTELLVNSGGCPSGPTKKTQYYRMMHVCKSKCSFGTGIQGQRGRTRTRTIYTCCEGYKPKLLSRVLGLYLCQSE